MIESFFFFFTFNNNNNYTIYTIYFQSRHLIECVHEEVIAIGMEHQRLPCEVYNLLGSTLRATVLEAFEVEVVEGLAQLSCRIF